jgi:TetR/AcrR family transcriptional regulator, mexJK operon transcriptional repressor
MLAGTLGDHYGDPTGGPMGKEEVIRKGRKFDQVLEGARSVFLRDGFEGASVDDIARAAGVSKATLYSYFPDKRLLFLEVARAECCRQVDETEALICTATTVHEVLMIAATRLVGFFLSEFSIRVFRVCAAESDRFPEIGQAFFENGPAEVRERLVTYFTYAESHGDLLVPDKPLAANQFMELCKADLFPKAMCGVGGPATAAEKAIVANASVEMFLARYGVRAS